MQEAKDVRGPCRTQGRGFRGLAYGGGHKGGGRGAAHSHTLRKGAKLRFRNLGLSDFRAHIAFYLATYSLIQQCSY